MTLMVLTQKAFVTTLHKQKHLQLKLKIFVLLAPNPSIIIHLYNILAYDRFVVYHALMDCYESFVTVFCVRVPIILFLCFIPRCASKHDNELDCAL